MRFNRHAYNRLMKGENTDDPELSKSKEIKLVLENARGRDFCKIVDFLEENNVQYICSLCHLEIGEIIVTTDMEVLFKGSKKWYKYSYDKIIKRIEDELEKS